ncbi:MAG: hypothetical protein M1833_001803 [Piccolia ochrophora]|nr:MAG: hypothetical protein M1833_001803 [Piccolia ochrophora]
MLIPLLLLVTICITFIKAILDRQRHQRHLEQLRRNDVESRAMDPDPATVNDFDSSCESYGTGAHSSPLSPTSPLSSFSGRSASTRSYPSSPTAGVGQVSPPVSPSDARSAPSQSPDVWHVRKRIVLGKLDAVADKITKGLDYITQEDYETFNGKPLPDSNHAKTGS